jgi:hypothetical protein
MQQILTLATPNRLFFFVENAPETMPIHRFVKCFGYLQPQELLASLAAEIDSASSVTERQLRGCLHVCQKIRLDGRRSPDAIGEG